MSAGSGSDSLRVRVGVDIVSVERIARLVTRYPAVQERLFAPEELRFCLARRNAHKHMAARFAAKEAVLKAFGTGLAHGMRWKDVEVVSGDGGRPRVVLAGEAAAFAERAGLSDLDLSLSHTDELAIAQVVTLWRPGSDRPPP